MSLNDPYYDAAGTILRTLAPDLTDQLVAAVTPLFSSGAADEVKVHAEHRHDGALLRLTDVAGRRSVEVVMDATTARDLARYLQAAR